jgi:hypothetical protein
MKFSVATIMMVGTLVAATSCKRSNEGGERADNPSDWTHHSWRFSRDTGLPSTGWIEFEPEGRKGAIRVVDFVCPTEPRCRYEGTFQATEDSIRLSVRPWENQSFRVRATDNVMEWTRNGVTVERFTYEKMTPMSAPDPDMDEPVKCKSDRDCPDNLACGPCDPNKPILNRYVRMSCTRNPCPGHSGYCTTNRICAVKP